MIRRRRNSSLTSGLAASFLVVALAADSRAAGMASYQLVNSEPAGSAPIAEVVAEIDPAGSVVAPASGLGPLTILPGSTGVQLASISDRLGTGTLPGGAPLEVVKLDFGPGGLAPGGVVNFGLALAAGDPGPPPTLLLEGPTATAGLSLRSYNAPVATAAVAEATPPTPTVIPATPVPEPLSIALWSVAAGIGLMRARAFRRVRHFDPAA